jgi:hypothetical protein
MTTRRRFLHDSSLLAVASLMAPASAQAGMVRTRPRSLDQLRFETFASNVGSTFWVLSEPGSATALELVSAKQTPPGGTGQMGALDGLNEKFSLVFRGLSSQLREQHTYLFEHGTIGRFEMFIVPIGAGNVGYQLYEAIFNRPVGHASAMRGNGALHLPAAAW